LALRKTKEKIIVKPISKACVTMIKLMAMV